MKNSLLKYLFSVHGIFSYTVLPGPLLRTFGKRKKKGVGEKKR
jgi:hypothetical protein